jgi:hypothetical protein
MIATRESLEARVGDIAVRRPATQLVVIGAAILLLLAGANIGYATLAAATSGHNGLIPAVIAAGTNNHLTVTVQSAPVESVSTKPGPKPKGPKHGKSA